jgi:hypothetical protein
MNSRSTHRTLTYVINFRAFQYSDDDLIPHVTCSLLELAVNLPVRKTKFVLCCVNQFVSRSTLNMNYLYHTMRMNSDKAIQRHRALIYNFEYFYY